MPRSPTTSAHTHTHTERERARAHTDLSDELTEHCAEVQQHLHTHTHTHTRGKRQHNSYLSDELAELCAEHDPGLELRGEGVGEGRGVHGANELPALGSSHDRVGNLNSNLCGRVCECVCVSVSE